jgi:uncharacterized protein (TIGR03382 family)
VERGGPDATLGDGDGSDAVFGEVAGNGGDWIELLTTEDVDLRGWRLRMSDRGGSAGELVFSDAPALQSIRAGTILTIAEDLPEDPSYDPDHGDWRLHLRSDGAYVSGGAFDVSSADWRLTILDGEGAIRFGPAGEGVGTVSGIGRNEAGVLEQTPDASFRRDTGHWKGQKTSTFGGPNVWKDGAQDLDVLRGITHGPVDVDQRPARGCGCDSGASAGMPLWILLLLLRRRR